MKPSTSSSTPGGAGGAEPLVFRLHPHADVRNPTRALASVLLALAVLLLAGPRVPDPAAQDSCIAAEDFSRAPVGQFPADWHARKDAARKVYTVQEEAGRRFLRAVARDIGLQAGKKLEWDLAEYPVLAWSWRPRVFPEGADERQPRRNDSVLAVYAVFPHSPVSVKAVKYVWSAVVPAGTQLTSSRGLTQVHVVRSGTRGAGQWVEERVNVVEDFRRSFGDDAPRPDGIAVLTDSDDTAGLAVGDYADFRLCRASPVAGSGAPAAARRN